MARTTPDHEHIWLEPGEGPWDSDGRMWCEHDVWGVHSEHGAATEYVRADIAAAAVEAVRKELERKLLDMRAALAALQVPEGQQEKQVAAWLRSRGYTVEPEPDGLAYRGG
jgi:hypothetical protein